MTMGTATFRNGKLYFDAEGWAMVKLTARLQHKTPTHVVTAALRRYFKRHEKDQKGHVKG